MARSPDSQPECITLFCRSISTDLTDAAVGTSIIVHTGQGLQLAFATNDTLDGPNADPCEPHPVHSISAAQTRTSTAPGLLCLPWQESEHAPNSQQTAMSPPQT